MKNLQVFSNKQNNQDFSLFNSLIQDEVRVSVFCKTDKNKTLLKAVHRQVNQWNKLSVKKQLQLLNVMIYDTNLSYTKICDMIVKPERDERGFFIKMVSIFQQIEQARELN